MSFGLKNAGAAYKCVIDMAFRDQIGRNVEAYVDDIVIKSHTEESMLRDILETFESLRKINMKLNPKSRGIKANSKKIQAIENMASPKIKKEVQSLNERLAALTRFLSRVAERSLPFVKVLKSCLNKKDFSWTAEAEASFQDVKQLLKELPTLTAPIAGETLILYMVVSAEAISSVLIAERNRCTTRRMRRYFQGHPILLLTDQPIKQILKHPESLGRLAKWAVELGEYEINFSLRHAVKGQILADFLLETTEKVNYSREIANNNCMWELHTDGASSEEGVGAGLVLTSLEGEEHTYALNFFYASNNEAEYEVLLSGLRIASEMGIKHLRAYVDSHIVAHQVNGAFEAKDISMKRYLQLVETISKNFETLEVVQISRNKNKKADKVLVEVLKDKSIDEKVVIATVKEGESCWMTPYVKYLQDGSLLDDVTEARRIKNFMVLICLFRGYGLKLKKDVIIFRPKNLRDAYCLAALQGDMQAVAQRKSTNLPISTPYASVQPIKDISSLSNTMALISAPQFSTQMTLSTTLLDDVNKSNTMSSKW
ncbi:uncharacterized protein [Rutidosis leptorrhynchoides]|uniref:uncharacterized protein n=1 Tax=Rutidosis leptorrhynchoides TaxID=125765 RepID=UPI003A999B76